MIEAKLVGEGGRSIADFTESADLDAHVRQLRDAEGAGEFLIGLLHVRGCARKVFDDDARGLRQSPDEFGESPGHECVEIWTAADCDLEIGGRAPKDFGGVGREADAC